MEAGRHAESSGPSMPVALLWSAHLFSHVCKQQASTEKGQHDSEWNDHRNIENGRQTNEIGT